MSLNSEQALLGALLIDPSKFSVAKGYVNTSDFYSDKNQKIFECFEYLHLNGFGCDIVSIQDYFKSKSYECDVNYINSLTELPLLIQHVNTYAWTVKQASLKRQIERSLKISLDGLKEKPEVLAEELISNAMTSLMHINYSDRDRATLKDATSLFLQTLKSGGRKLLSTGFNELDNIIPGIPTNSLIVIGADSGVGKTVFAINMALNKAKKGEKVLIVSLEINFHDLLEILLPQLSDSDVRITYQELIKNEHSLNEIERLEDLITNKLNDLGIYFVCNCYGIEEIITALDYHKRNFDIDCAIVDHAQLVTGASDYSRYTEITKTFMQYKNRNNLSITLLSQLNDNKEKRADKEPRKTDLRAGGNLYQDADIVLFLYKLEPQSKQVYLKISKNRKGATNNCNYLDLTFDPQTRRIYLNPLKERPSLEEDEEEPKYTPRRKRKEKPQWIQGDINDT